MHNRPGPMCHFHWTCLFPGHLPLRHPLLHLHCLLQWCYQFGCGIKHAYRKKFRYVWMACWKVEWDQENATYTGIWTHDWIKSRTRAQIGWMNSWSPTTKDDEVADSALIFLDTSLGLVLLIFLTKNVLNERFEVGSLSINGNKSSIIIDRCLG